MPERGSPSWRWANWGQPARPRLSPVTLGSARISVDERIVEATRALDHIFARHGHVPSPPDVGAYNPRHIGNDPRRPWSSHAWAIAIDVDWLDNPDGPSLTGPIAADPALIHDVHAIHTVSGIPVWRWGGDWDRDPRTDHSYYDPMHFETIATPAELTSGIAPLDQEENDMTLRRGDQHGDVSWWQRRLADVGFYNGPINGKFDARTEEAVKAVQAAAGWTPDGAITWTLGDYIQQLSHDQVKH